VLEGGAVRVTGATVASEARGIARVRPVSRAGTEMSLSRSMAGRESVGLLKAFARAVMRPTGESAGASPRDDPPKEEGIRAWLEVPNRQASGPPLV